MIQQQLLQAAKESRKRVAQKWQEACEHVRNDLHALMGLYHMLQSKTHPPTILKLPSGHYGFEPAAIDEELWQVWGPIFTLLESPPK